MTTSTVWLWLSFGLIVLGLSACSDDFVALIKARHATSELRGTIYHEEEAENRVRTKPF